MTEQKIRKIIREEFKVLYAELISPNKDDRKTKDLNKPSKQKEKPGLIDPKKDDRKDREIKPKK